MIFYMLLPHRLKNLRKHLSGIPYSAKKTNIVWEDFAIFNVRMFRFLEL
jgi:hypothetical protein